jgi:PAS domain S-box-containing protein
MLKDDSGNPIGAAAVNRDITERKRAEEALKEERDRAQKYLDIAGVMIVAIDSHGTITLLNKRGCDILGYEEGELVGRNWFDTCLPMPVRAPVKTVFDRLMAGEVEPVEYFENPVVTKQGEERIVAWHNTVLSDESGTIIGTLSSGEDITERKQAEAELTRHRYHLETLVAERTVQLEAANEELEAFAYSVSHDLRAPLRHIEGFLQLLLQRKSERLDSDALHYLNAIARSTDTMGELIDDLLQFSRASQAEIDVQRVESEGLVRESQQELASEQEGRNITWEIDPLPAVEGDPALLRQVWVNLLSNAIKYTAPRSVAHIRIGSIHDADRDNETTLFVKDNGVGFDPRYTHKLFGVFQRLHREEEFSGTGIGLATVRRIIHRHRGQVWAEGELDQGATFYFTLRQAQEQGREERQI